MHVTQMLYYCHRLILCLFHIVSLWKVALARVLFLRGVPEIPLRVAIRDNFLWCTGSFLGSVFLCCHWIPNKKQPKAVKAYSGSYFKTHIPWQWRRHDSTEGKQLVVGTCLCRQEAELERKFSTWLLLFIWSTTTPPKMMRHTFKEQVPPQFSLSGNTLRDTSWGALPWRISWWWRLSVANALSALREGCFLCRVVAW